VSSGGLACSKNRFSKCYYASCAACRLAGFYRLNPLQTQRSETSDEDIRADSNKSAQSAYVRVCGLEREREGVGKRPWRRLSPMLVLIVIWRKVR